MREIHDRLSMLESRIHDGFVDVQQQFGDLRSDLAELVGIERERSRTAEVPPPVRPAVVQVMDHPRLPWVLGALVLSSMAVAGSLTWSDVRPHVPGIIVETELSAPAPVRPPLPAPYGPEPS